MNLAEYQRAMMRVSFQESAAAEDLALLGAEDRAVLYRQMIRSRLLGMSKVAFKQTARVLGDAFDASFARYLAVRPPCSRYIREVVAEFGPFVREDAGLLAKAPPAFFLDLVRFEETKWRLAYVERSSPVARGPVRELDFEGEPVWNPLLACLDLAYAVHKLSEDAEPALLSGTLLMYRPAKIDEVRWYLADSFFVALLRASQRNNESLAELVRKVAHEEAREMNATLLESLATSLTLAMERGVLLGVC